MAKKRDYYQVLGIERSATDAQISEAYRRMAMQYHPDRNPGDEEAVAHFKEAAEAFEVLNNPQTRARYDRFGHAGLEGGGAPHFQDLGDIFDAFGDLFGDFFGGPRGRGRRRVQRGADIRCDVTLDLLEAAHGCTKTIEFQRHRACQTCRGSGAKPGTQPETCPYCGGRGQVIQSTGIFSLQTTCPSCHGAGHVIRQPCPGCRGVGYVPKPAARKVEIPAGVDNNIRVRLQGEGEPSPQGGPPGDCYVIVHVEEHPLFERHGQHVVVQVPIGYSQAALGATIEVPTLDGREEFTISPGTQNGEIFKLTGRGIPDPRTGSRGDLLIQIHVEVAKHVDPEHEAILRKLAEHEQRNVTPQRSSFFQKLKEYFRSE